MTHEELVAEVRRLHEEVERLKVQNDRTELFVNPRWASPVLTVRELYEQMQKIRISPTDVESTPPPV